MKSHNFAALATMPSALLSMVAAGYVWPDKYDYMEDIYMLQSGFNRMGFIDGILSCGFGQRVPGRQNSAEWIRTAYHDIATADVEAGTGGLDASIQFETERGENKGSAFNNTFGHFSGYYSPRSSVSDLLALAVVGSMAICGGYEIPLRVGRIDATEAGPMGVPEPQQDLPTHTAKFAKQGFNQTEMIELVACGHTLGSIHGANFPEITKDNSTGQVSHFEYGESATVFDNTVVHEYLASNTSNLLVAGSNDTLNSDKRIFGADKNVTMNLLSDNTYFQTRCQDVMTRMIDTVPKEVVLSDPIIARDIKPYINLLALNSNGSIDFSGYIRVRYGTNTKYPNADDLSAYLTYTDRNGNNFTKIISTTRPTWQAGTGAGFRGYTFVYFEWDTQLASESGIGSFHIHVTTKSTNTTQEYNNGGNGYPVQDKVLYQMKQSCASYTPNGAVYDGSLTIMAAVRSTEVPGHKQLNLHFDKHVSRQGVVLDAFETQIEAFNATGKTLTGYELFKIDGMYIGADSSGTTFSVVLGDTTVIDFKSINALTQQECATIG
ncbi:heme peroxidase [Lentithecium fluviatile CBS 122367]|uniref:Peroxidase n=1 Tax=Lentithecium fluviatile CBS 122367 TaxID=1168545 RepID=A0A6G1J088_9PLEO|nr:heme peroxidase [Lentithecium fluviatile CBS 122367]